MDEVLEFVLAVKAAHREINRRFSEALRPLGVTVVQAEALLVLAESGPLSLKDLGAHVVAEAGNPSRLVDRLTASGLVRRHAVPDDRRQVHVGLTPKGRRLAHDIRTTRQPLLDWGRRVLDGEGIRTATDVLHRLLDQD
ncbi:MarR family transcriptional regulator [Saccharomonospora sp. NPDC046836]|uniref:MarR family winged helix-turn-helix transcriptional regulator n=1 Tax=Saccharomonospora sp. NPDC046836 TaxID=3156921 RepID=UPI0034101A60